MIRVEGLGKKFLIWHDHNRERYTALREVIMRNAKTLYHKSCDILAGRPIDQGERVETFWALKDITFQAEHGDVIGIIGRNGAGKSTLLKILSRITEPSEGRAIIRGRVASLLEVGTGFHPELTGRENIYLNGAILGMSQAETRHKFDEIVAFAEVERFLDTPVKRYSSGMYVRLAFAVAAHLEPEILIVDEVLAVGDAGFQKKCLGKIQSSAALEGRTVLFVSHNLPAVRTLCTKGVVLDGGRIAFSGGVNEAVDAYLDTSATCTLERNWKHTSNPPGDDVFELICVRVRCSTDDNPCLTIEEDIIVEVDYKVLVHHQRINVSIHVYTQGVCAFVGWNDSSPHGLGSYRASCRIPAHLLNNSIYSLSVFLITNMTEVRVMQRDVITFTMEETKPRSQYVGSVAGALRPQLQWTLAAISAESVEEQT